MKENDIINEIAEIDHEVRRIKTAIDFMICYFGSIDSDHMHEIFDKMLGTSQKALDSLADFKIKLLESATE